MSNGDLEKRKHFKRERELDYEFPPIPCIIVFVPAILCVIAWIFSIFVGWERYPWLKFLCLAPLAILLIAFLPTIIRKVRSMSEWKE